MSTRPAPPPRVAFAAAVSDAMFVGTVAAISAVIAVAVVGVPLAILGLFRPALVIPAVLVGAVLGPGAVWPARRQVRATPAALALVVAGVGLTTVLGVLFPSHHFVVNRDPGAYTVTGLWLAEEGGLLVDGLEGPFADAQGLTAESLAFRTGERADGALYAQFTHLTSAVLAVGQWVGGDVAMVRVMPLIGGAAMVALFFLIRLYVRPMAAAVSTVVLAVSLPQLWFSRDTYSEPVAQLLLLGGLALLVVALRQRLLPVVALAALSLGAVFSARLDGIAYLAPLAVLLGVLAVRAGWSRRAAAVLWVGVLVPVVVALVDLALRSPVYLADHWSVVRPPLVVSAATVVLAPIVVMASDRVAPLRAAVATSAPVVSRVAPWLAVVALLLLWQVRPLVQTVREESANAWLDSLAAAEGVAEGGRAFSEYSLDWVSWYLGPVALAAAIAGAGVAVRRALAAADDDLWSVLLVLAPVSLLYWWRPSIAPDHIWVMRRFLPAALPLVVLCLALCLDWLWSRRGEVASITRPAAFVVGALSLGVPALISLPFADAREVQIAASSMNELCEAVGPDAAVLFLQGHGVDEQFPVPVRAGCGVPTAAGSRNGDYGPLAEAWSRQGRRLVLVSSVAEAVPDRRVIGTVHYPLQHLETTLTRRPGQLLEYGGALVLYEG